MQIFSFFSPPYYCWLSLHPDEGPPCTCPLCASDWSTCVPHGEGLQLSRDLGATYLELPSLNNFFVGRYFGSVVSIFICQQVQVKLHVGIFTFHVYNIIIRTSLTLLSRIPNSFLRSIYAHYTG